jgi:hypothetical protein
MFFGLVHLIPSLSTSLSLIAFISAVVAFVYFIKMRSRQNLIAQMLRSDRFKALNAIFTHIDIDTSKPYSAPTI